MSHPSQLRRAGLAGLLLATVALVAGPGAAGATSAVGPPGDRPLIEVFRADLDPVPHDASADGGSSTKGRATLIRTPRRVIAVLFVRGAAANLPHAEHVHGIGLNRCPDASADTNGDGLVSTAEGQPDYGAVVTSLTTTGDTSPASGLAVDRFPTANFFGFYVYVRSLDIGTDIPAEVANNLDQHHIVVHGIDTNGNGQYDFSAGDSSLDPSLPLEATVPAACGTLES